MADNEEVFSFGIEDDGTLDEIIARFQRSIENIVSSSVDAFEKSTRAAEVFGDTLDEINAAWQAGGAESEAEKIDALAESVRRANTAMEQAIQDTNDLNAAFERTTGIGGVVSDTGDGGDGGGGSLFGVARGLRAGAGIGRLAGAGTETTGALTGAADVLYLQQAFSKLSDILPALNKAAEDSGGIIGSLAEDFATLGIPMGGIAASILTLTPALAALGGAFLVLKGQVDEGAAGVAAGIKQLDEYYKIIDSGKTATQITADLATQNQKLADAQTHLKEVNDQIISSIQQGIEGGGVLGAVVGAGKVAASEGVAELKKDAEDTKKVIDAATAARNADNAALADGSLIAASAADQARKDAQDHIAISARLAADDAATLKADQARVESLYTQNDALQGSITVLQNANQIQGLLPDQIAKNNEAITAYQKTLQDNEAEITHINSISEVYAQKREAMAAADEQYLKMLDQSITQSKQAADDAALGSQANADKAAKLREERDATQQAITALEAHGIASDADQKKLDTLTAQLQNFDVELNNLVQDFHPAQMREAADAIQKADEAYNKAIDNARNNLTNATNDLYIKERASEQQYTPGSEQDTFARDTIALKEQRDVAKIELDTSDKIADIRTKLGEKESQITTDYNRQIFDDQIKFQQDVQKLVTSEHNQEQIDAIDHANKLADIRQKSMIDEADDVANRDFIKLAKDQQTQQTSIQKEDQSFALKEENQRTHLAQQEQDLATALANQEKQQQVAEGRKIADAQLAADNAIAQQKADEQRKIDASRTAEQQQLDDLERNNLQKITLLRQQAYNEYELQVIQENQREQLALQTQQAIVSQNQAIMQAGTNAYIDNLNRLNQMAYNGGSTSAVSIPASNTVTAPNYTATAAAIAAANQPQTQSSGFDLGAAATQLAGALQGALFGS